MAKPREPLMMWWKGQHVPAATVPETHPDGSPVQKPTTTPDARWKASGLPPKRKKRRSK